MAVEAYAIAEDRYPPTMNLDLLSSTITPTYLRDMIREDAWGGDYVYLSDTKSYRIVSGGADGRVSADSQKLNATTGDFGDDLIFENGEFIQPRPAQ